MKRIIEYANQDQTKVINELLDNNIIDNADMRIEETFLNTCFFMEDIERAEQQHKNHGILCLTSTLSNNKLRIEMQKNNTQIKEFEAEIRKLESDNRVIEKAKAANIDDIYLQMLEDKKLEIAW